MGIALAACCSVLMSVQRPPPHLMESPCLGERQKFHGSMEAMTLSWNSKWNCSDAGWHKMLEEGSHSHRRAPWKCPQTAFQMQCTHTTSSNTHCDCTTTRSPQLSPGLPQCTGALFLGARVFSSSIPLDIANSPQAVPSPSFCSTEVIN